MNRNSDIRILVVEDSRFFNHLVTRSVRERVSGQVTSALTFAETRAAVEAAAQANSPFHLALVDLVLPDAMRGEAVDWLLAREVPCLVFTGIFSPDMRERLLTQNVIDYVVKDTPSSLDYLMGLVEQLSRNRGVRVLVVDDSRSSRQHIRHLLETYQFDVVEAGNGRDGLALLEADDSIRLVITDYIMPEMDGIEMIKRIRAERSLDRLAIIGMSSGGGSTLSARFIKMGANDYINKPFLPEEFFCRVMQNMRMLSLVERLSDIASRDALTGLHNRRFFFEGGEPLFAIARRDRAQLSVAMIDIDFFKKVNDRWGHDAGDEVLRQVGRLLASMCRKTDIVARLGGEEFAVIAVNADPAAIAVFFERLRAAVEALDIHLGEAKIPVTASFGVCVGLRDSLSGMLKLADEQLYKAKQNGRNRVEMTGTAADV